ncbi:MAG: hypothetical protein KKA73_06990 [Chloroflexi bacterium]|nr:hypothetical protein [Chloroflexota bacterium]MBU1747416.1 hypothetical protein [Chloroflexota bacterium]
MPPVPPLDPQRFARAFAAAMQAVQQGGAVCCHCGRRAHLRYRPAV